MNFLGKLLVLLGLSLSASSADAENAMTIPTTYDALLEAGFAHVQALQNVHEGTWKMSEAERYDVDLSAGQIYWTYPDKIVSAPAELLGTWSPQDGTFLWGWDHPSAPPGSAVSTAALKSHAVAHGITELQSSKTACDFDECWKLAAAAGLVGDLQGISRFEASPGGPWAYIGFGNITISPKTD